MEKGVFERVFRDRGKMNLKAVIGVCMDAKRLDCIQQVVSSADEEILNYLYEIALKYCGERNFRMKLLQFVLSVY